MNRLCMRTWSGLVAGVALALLVGAGGARAKDHPFYEPADPAAEKLGKNLFRKAAVTASGHWSKQTPSLAVDGDRGRGSHWACENIPVWLTVDLKDPTELNTIRLWTWWGAGRYYQFQVEGSADGTNWRRLADERGNTRPSDEAGWTFSFPTARLRYVRTTLTKNSSSNVSGGHIVEIEGYALGPREQAELASRHEGWAALPPGEGGGLSGAVGSVDVRYARGRAPETGGSSGRGMEWRAVAWRGERVHGQFVLWTRDGASQVRLAVTPLVKRTGERIPASCVRPHFVRYVLGDGKLWGDVLDVPEELDLSPRTVRPVWLSVDVPARARPGVYKGKLTVRSAGREPLSFDLVVEVLPNVLPPPEDWAFHLDLWQNPWSVASYHRVKPWSEEHSRLLEPVLRMLAEAGQKCLTTTIVHRPWSAQTFDPFGSMVKWTRRADGRWTFDYTLFDKYVEFGAKCGLNDAINCYSMVPWGYRFHYYDEKTGDFQSVSAKAGTEKYRELWGAFLADFAAHLKKRGWFERTCIAMDERPVGDMLKVIALVREVAPGLKVTLAGGDHKELYDSVHDYCIFISHRLDKAMLGRRRERGQPTTFYVCCGPRRPNTFTFSPPAESAWLGWFAAAHGYGGFLRWAYNSWVRDPLVDTSYPNWPAGDCFVIYPGPRSSIRFERLREGIQDYEKIRIVRAALERRGARGREGLRKLDRALGRFSYPKIGNDTELARTVREAKEVLVGLSRAVSGR